MITYKDHIGLNLKKITAQPKDSWREDDKCLEKRIKKYINEVAKDQNAKIEAMD